MTPLAHPAEPRVLVPRLGEELVASRYDFFAEDALLEDGGMLVWNALTGAAGELDPDEARLLRRLRAGERLRGGELVRSAGHIAPLFAAGFVTTASDREEERVESDWRYWRETREHVDLTIAPTLDCNFACRYCGQRRSRESLTQGDVAAIGRFLERLIDDRVRTVVVHWYGGEPTLVPDAIRELSSALLDRVERSGSATFAAEMFTNAWLLDASLCEMLRDECRVGALMVSLDGPASVHDGVRGGQPALGTLDVTLDRVELALRSFDVKLRIHCHLGNVSRMGELLETLAARKLHDARSRFGHVCTLHFVRLYDFTDVCRDVRAIRIPARRWGEIECDLLAAAQAAGFPVTWLPARGPGTYCMGQRENAFLIVPGGRLYTCFHEDLAAPTHARGSVADGAIPYALVGGRDAVQRAECRKCVYLPICSGDCPGGFWSDAQCTAYHGNVERRLVELWRRERRGTTSRRA